MKAIEGRVLTGSAAPIVACAALTRAARWASLVVVSGVCAFFPAVGAPSTQQPTTPSAQRAILKALTGRLRHRAAPERVKGGGAVVIGDYSVILPRPAEIAPYAASWLPIAPLRYRWTTGVSGGCVLSELTGDPSFDQVDKDRKTIINEKTSTRMMVTGYACHSHGRYSYSGSSRRIVGSGRYGGGIVVILAGESASPTLLREILESVAPVVRKGRRLPSPPATPRLLRASVHGSMVRAGGFDIALPGFAKPRGTAAGQFGTLRGYFDLSNEFVNRIDICDYSGPIPTDPQRLVGPRMLYETTRENVQVSAQELVIKGRGGLWFLYTGYAAVVSQDLPGSVETLEVIMTTRDREATRFLQIMRGIRINPAS